MVCWRGSGFTFKKIEKKQIGLINQSVQPASKQISFFNNLLRFGLIRTRHFQ